MFFIYLISQSKSSLSKMVGTVRDSLSQNGLTLNTEKHDYLCFNSRASSSPLESSDFTIPIVFLKWLSISVCSSVVSMRNKHVDDSRKKTQVGYSKIVASRGRFVANRGKLHASYIQTLAIMLRRFLLVFLIFPVDVVS